MVSKRIRNYIQHKYTKKNFKCSRFSVATESGYDTSLDMERTGPVYISVFLNRKWSRHSSLLPFNPSFALTVSERENSKQINCNEDSISNAQNYES